MLGNLFQLLLPHFPALPEKTACPTRARLHCPPSPHQGSALTQQAILRQLFLGSWQQTETGLEARERRSWNRQKGPGEPQGSCSGVKMRTAERGNKQMWSQVEHKLPQAAVPGSSWRGSKSPSLSTCWGLYTLNWCSDKQVQKSK